MLRNVGTALKEATVYLALIIKGFRLWRREPPVTTLEALVTYAETRSKFVAQTTLYGYIRTRAGTRYVSLLEDEIFARSVNIAKWEIFLVCLCDLAVYAAARIGRSVSCADSELARLAIRIVETALAREEIPKERPQGFGDVVAEFRRRAALTAWRDVAEGEAGFQASLEALVEWAPVADELKVFDVEIVKNSMRFKWKKVRDQLNGLLVPEAVLENWRTSNSVDGPAAARTRTRPPGD